MTDTLAVTYRSYIFCLKVGDLAVFWAQGDLDMYAVIVSGGKQHRVVQGETLKLEKLELGEGETVKFDKVLLVGEGESVKIGSPYVEGGEVTAEIVSQGRAKKIEIIKFNRRKHFRKQQGHRQWFTEVKITGIKA